MDTIGGGYTASSPSRAGLGGSEIEILQVAKGLTARGYRVVVANGVDSMRVDDGVTYIPHAQAWQHPPSKVLYLQRWSTPETRLEISSGVRVLVRANDTYGAPYDAMRDLLTSGRVGLVTNTRWQAGLFGFAKDVTVIPPMLEPMPHIPKQPGLFLFASGAMKGFEATVTMWCDLKSRHQVMQRLQLAVISPGWGIPRALTSAESAAGIQYIGNLPSEEYRHWIAKAEGLFTVLDMPETFGCAAALAERAGTRTHILCRAGLGGLLESVQDQFYVTENAEDFERDFIAALGQPPAYRDLPDLRPSSIMDRWMDTMRLRPSASGISHVPGFPDDPSLASNQEPLGPFFGDFLSLLRGAIVPGGSEYGAGLMLFSLATAIQARSIVEIGRFKGFSTLALAAACRLQDLGWTEPKVAEQRPDIDYPGLRQRPAPHLISIDPAPLPEARALVDKADLGRFVEYLDMKSEDVTIRHAIDLLFIDGGHSTADVRADIQRFVPLVRPGGYFILHDYFGWFRSDGTNGSPVASVIADDLTGCDRVLIDTHYASFVLFRKSKSITERWELTPKPGRIPARTDGRPTVGLCLIAKGDEVSTVATRAIMSAKRAGVDCVTVVCDATETDAEIARALGADVFIRPSPLPDWDRGIGVIAGARNVALDIAERRTDYVLVLDADDHFDGTLPDRFDHDAYEITIHDGGLQYSRVQLFRSALGWRYTGIIHETPAVAGSGPIGVLPDLRYMRGRSNYGHQDQDRPAVKYSKHAYLANKWLIDHPEDSRTQFYLARSYHDAGRFDEAIPAYEQRIKMTNGWEEERSYSAYQIGRILMEQGKDPTSALLRAHEIGVPKAEPLVYLARWHRDETRRQFSTAYTFARRAAEIPQPVMGGLFIETSIYQFEAAAEAAICAYWIGRKQEAFERFEELLPRLPAERRKWGTDMMAVCSREIAVS